MQHPRNLVPVSHAYLVMVRFVFRSAIKTSFGHQRSSPFWCRVFDVPSTSAWTKEVSWLRCCIARIGHVKDFFLMMKERRTCGKSRTMRTMRHRGKLRIIKAGNRPQAPSVLNSSQLQVQESQVFTPGKSILYKSHCCKASNDGCGRQQACDAARTGVAVC
jgi:hypothetical protein